jgi:NADH-quinone oxidoreductase subunit J
VAGVFFFAVVGWLITNTTFATHDIAAAEEWAPSRVGHAFLTTYSLVFEALSIVLLMAIIGAVLVAREEEPQP